MRKEWLLVVFVIGLVAFLNGCCKKQTCPDCTVIPSAQAASYQPAQAPAQGDYAGSRAVK